MKTLVTGANGHIGSHVVRALLAEGHDVVGFVRPGSDRRALAGLDVELREGDLLESDSVARAVQGTTAVIHVGAVHRNFHPDPNAIVRPAVDGTANVLAALRKHPVEVFIYTSTGATIGFAADPRWPLNEEHFFPAGQSAYIRGKVLAEQAVLKFAAEEGAPRTVLVNPSGVFGPRDYRLTPASRALMGLLQGDPAFLHLCVTHVEDVARGHALALEKGTHGRRYLLTGSNLSPAQLGHHFRDVAGIKPPTFRPPAFLLDFLVGRMEKKAAREGSDAPASRDALADLGRGNLVYDSTRSRKELGLAYRDARSVLEDSFRWLLHVGALRPGVAKKIRARMGDAALPDQAWLS